MVGTWFEYIGRGGFGYLFALIMHKELITKYQQQFASDPNLNVLLVTGSFARGEHRPASDLDLIAIGNYEPKFVETTEKDITVEIKYRSIESFKEKISKDPINCYQFLDAKVILGDEKTLANIRYFAEETLKNYQPETGGIVKWISSSLEKIIAAEGNDHKTAFIIVNTLWKVLEGIYAVNKLPIPPMTTAYRMVLTLNDLPVNFEQLWQEILLGTIPEKTSAFKTLANFVTRKAG